MVEITYEELLEQLESLPNIARKVILDENRRDLSRKRSNFLGGGRRR